MNKINAVLGIVIILLSAGCGILYYQIGDMSNQNSDLQNQIVEYQNQTSQLENQIDTLEKQADDFHFQLNHVEYKIGKLEAQNLELQARNIELQNQTRELENTLDKVSSVKITGFKFVQTINPAIMALYSWVNITVQNFGIKDIEDLQLSVEHVSGDFQGSTVQLGLKAGENKTVKTDVWWDYQVAEDFVVTLTLDGIVLDEHHHVYNPT